MKVQITRHSSSEPEIVEETEYNADELSQKINSGEHLTIPIGDQIFSRIDIKHVKVIEE